MISSLGVFFFQVLVDLLVQVNTEIFRLLRLIRAVRAIRSLRVLRTINFMKSLQLIVSTLLKSVPAMMNIVFLTVIILCKSALSQSFLRWQCKVIFTVIGKTLYSSIDPERFGTLGRTAFRLFQVMTFENWGFYYSDSREEAPTMWLYLWTFIIVVNFVFIKYEWYVFIEVLRCVVFSSPSSSVTCNKRGLEWKSFARRKNPKRYWFRGWIALPYIFISLIEIPKCKHRITSERRRFVKSSEWISHVGVSSASTSRSNELLFGWHAFFKVR